jgi:thioredoxin-related protein
VRTFLAILVLALAGGASLLLRRRQSDAPAQIRGAVPFQLNLKDFSIANKKWLVAVFTSSTCDACRDVSTKARVLESNEVAVEIIDFLEMRDLHARYQIDSVPTTVIADIDGIVRFATVGPLTATDLWAALAKCRDPKVLSDVPTCRDEKHDH